MVCAAVTGIHVCALSTAAEHFNACTGLHEAADSHWHEPVTLQLPNTILGRGTTLPLMTWPVVAFTVPFIPGQKSASFVQKA